MGYGYRVSAEIKLEIDRVDEELPKLYLERTESGGDDMVRMSRSPRHLRRQNHHKS